MKKATYLFGYAALKSGLPLEIMNPQLGWIPQERTAQLVDIIAVLDNDPNSKLWGLVVHFRAKK